MECSGVEKRPWSTMALDEMDMCGFKFVESCIRPGQVVIFHAYIPKLRVSCT